MLYATSDRVKDCKNIVEGSVKRVEDRINKLGLDLSPNKSNIVVFNNREDRANRVRCMIAGVVSVKERAELTARNFWTKIVGGRNKSMMNRLNRLCILDSRDSGTVGGGSLSVIKETWSEFKMLSGDLESLEEPALYKKKLLDNYSSSQDQFGDWPELRP